MMRGTRTLLVLALAAACGAPAEDEADARPGTDSPAPPRIAAPSSAPHERDAWLRAALAAERLDRAALRVELGEPSRTARQPQPNRHEAGVTDTLIELEYEDARFVYYVVSAGPSELLDYAEVRDDRHLALTPPGIGTPVDSLRAWWGAPVAASDSTLEYDCDTCEVPLPATFVLDADGRVRAIRFDLYVD